MLLNICMYTYIHTIHIYLSSILQAPVLYNPFPCLLSIYILMFIYILRNFIIITQNWWRNGFPKTGGGTVPQNWRGNGSPKLAAKRFPEIGGETVPQNWRRNASPKIDGETVPQNWRRNDSQKLAAKRFRKIGGETVPQN